MESGVGVDLYNKILAQPLPDEDLGIDMVLLKHGEDGFKDSFSTSAT